MRALSRASWDGPRAWRAQSAWAGARRDRGRGREGAAQGPARTRGARVQASHCRAAHARPTMLTGTCVSSSASACRCSSPLSHMGCSRICGGGTRARGHEGRGAAPGAAKTGAVRGAVRALRRSPPGRPAVLGRGRARTRAYHGLPIRLSLYACPCARYWARRTAGRALPGRRCARCHTGPPRTPA